MSIFRIPLINVLGLFLLACVTGSAFAQQLKPRQQPYGMLLSTSASKSCHQNGCVFGLTVQEVLPGSAAADAGIQANDLVMTVRGTPVANARQVIEAVANVSEPLSMQVFRAGDMITISDTSRAKPNPTKVSQTTLLSEKFAAIERQRWEDKRKVYAASPELGFWNSPLSTGPKLLTEAENADKNSEFALPKDLLVRWGGLADLVGKNFYSLDQDFGLSFGWRVPGFVMYEHRFLKGNGLLRMYQHNSQSTYLDVFKANGLWTDVEQVMLKPDSTIHYSGGLSKIAMYHILPTNEGIRYYDKPNSTGILLSEVTAAQYDDLHRRSVENAHLKMASDKKSSEEFWRNVAQGIAVARQTYSQSIQSQAAPPVGQANLPYDAAGGGGTERQTKNPAGPHRLVFYVYVPLAEPLNGQNGTCASQVFDVPAPGWHPQANDLSTIQALIAPYQDRILSACRRNYRVDENAAKFRGNVVWSAQHSAQRVRELHSDLQRRKQAVMQI